ncbi:hypothetical protein [Exilibacterium tricleocarpae]|uniref:hypothetical protein n=1 Tax=Exilibacterium tricleocarpae TaxID=2591008 RepID=UPI0015D0FCA8|nr:hypothetical protein [Exilibacterium tricleocarpae]
MVVMILQHILHNIAAAAKKPRVPQHLEKLLKNRQIFWKHIFKNYLSSATDIGFNIIALPKITKMQHMLHLARAGAIVDEQSSPIPSGNDSVIAANHNKIYTSVLTRLSRRRRRHL